MASTEVQQALLPVLKSSGLVDKDCASLSSVLPLEVANSGSWAKLLK